MENIFPNIKEKVIKLIDYKEVKRNSFSIE